ncbi:MAG: hypothetical protein AMJ45_06850 [Syntrophobacter sp. DG_60]|nr:MAG: hypothetical protein AMJ45_06850 [Syntrophobacter sp. DG_60]
MFKRDKTQKKPPRPRVSFKERYRCFQNLLSENNAVLEIMADMEEKLSGEYLFDMQYVRSNCEKLAHKVKIIIDNLNKISHEKYKELYDLFEKINSEIEAIVNKKRKIPVSDFVIPFENITKDMADIVGGKNANLGEVKNQIRLPVPDGFAITTYAYKRLIDYNKLSKKINQKLLSINLNDTQGIINISKDIKELVLKAQVPSDLETAILNASAALSRKYPQKIKVSLRSSAIYEDTEFTFAGQYATDLNVALEDIIFKYKEIIASLFSPRAIFYYKSKGFYEEDMAMAVGVLTMIGANTSGVIYTQSPDGLGKDIIINAVWGLGRYAVEGTVTPQIYVIKKDGSQTILEKNIGPQEFMLTCGHTGVEEVTVLQDLKGMPCLTEPQLKTLAEYAVLIENHYSRPQDIEWALDKKGSFYILQTRPLKIRSKHVSMKLPDLKDYKVLIDKGAIACRGIGIGKAYFVSKDEDLNTFPEGAVMVAKHTSPKFVIAMGKASAIVTDIGSATGHMASLAREFQIPTILNAEVATKRITPGKEITVDAVNGNIYEGAIQELKTLYKREHLFKDAPVLKTLAEIAKRIVPLNLLNPDDENFKPQHCQTYHDITRLAHQESMNEMFGITDGMGPKGAMRLAARMPLQIYIIDLGGGLKEDISSQVARVEDIRSIPLNALLKGILSLEWPGPRPVDISGFLSMAAHAPLHIPANRGWEDQLWERSFIMASREYMNFALRLGFHLSTIEAYVGDNINDNYIRFFFKGGGAGFDRISRRLNLIKEVLENLDFEVKLTADVLDAKITKYKRSAMERRLDMLGRLTVFTKNLDIVLHNRDIMEQHIQEFLKEHVS